MDEILNELLDEKKIQEVYENLDDYDIQDLLTLKEELDYLVSEDVKQAYPGFNLEKSEKYRAVALLYKAINEEGLERQTELNELYKEEKRLLDEVNSSILKNLKVVENYSLEKIENPYEWEKKKKEYHAVANAYKQLLEDRVVFIDTFDKSTVPGIKSNKGYKAVAKEIRPKRDEFLKMLKLAEVYIASEGLGGMTPMNHLEDYTEDKEALELYGLDNKEVKEDIDAPDFTMKAINHKDAKDKFNQGIINWAGNLRDSLNYIGDKYSSAQKTRLSIDDFIGVLSMIPKVGKYIAAAHTIYKTLETTFNKLKTSDATTFESLHKMWEMELKKFIQKQEYPKIFEAFQKDFEKKYEGKKYKLEDVEDEILIFLQQLPIDEISQKLVGQLLNNLPDSYADGEDYAGVAEVTINHHINDLFKAPSGNIGQIDDADEKLVEAIKATFHGKSIIELPIPIIITINRYPRGGVGCVLKRKSQISGNTSFKVIKGEKIYLERFMRAKAYKLLMVSDLTYDA